MAEKNETTIDLLSLMNIPILNNKEIFIHNIYKGEILDLFNAL